MNIYVEYSSCNPESYLCEAKRNLVDLMALEIRARRQEHEIHSRISAYEGYASDALNAGEETLAQEIALEIATMESKLAGQARTNGIYYAEVSRLKDMVHNMEFRLHGYGVGENLQYTLDYIEAQAELAEGGEYRALERKMFAAGIGKQFDSSLEILNRIRARQNDQD